MTKETGDYQFCMDNTFSRFSNKVVYFEIMTDEEEPENEIQGLPTDEDTYDVKLDDFKVL